MEDRLGLRLVCEMVNTSRRLKGLMHLGQTAIYNTYLALKPVTNWIGDADPSRAKLIQLHHGQLHALAG